MAITILNPGSGGTIPTCFTASGIFDPGSATTPAVVTFTDSNGKQHTADIHLCSNGNWVAKTQICAPTGNGATCDAYYTDTGTGKPVNAPQTKGIGVSDTAIASPIPICIDQFRKRHTDGKEGKLSADSTPPCPCECLDTLTCSAQYYPKHLKFQKAVAILFRQGSQDPVTVQPVLAKFGNWSVLVPKPADFPANPYTLYIVFLDRDGLPVLTGHFGLQNC